MSDEAYIPPGASEREIQIRRQVHAQAGFYRHLMVYLAVNLGLTLVNVVQMTASGLSYSFKNWWAFWPLFGWGIGVFFHGVSVFLGRRGPFSDQWQERRVKQLLDGRNVP
jgi:hypothetical protein